MNYYPILLQLGGGEKGGMLTSLLPLLLVFVIFWFFMIRPQAKKQKELRKFRESLKKGDKVITSGGIYGKIVEVRENIVVIQVDENVRLKVDKAGVLKDMSDAAPQK